MSHRGGRCCPGQASWCIRMKRRRHRPEIPGRFGQELGGSKRERERGLEALVDMTHKHDR